MLTLVHDVTCLEKCLVCSVMCCICCTRGPIGTMHMLMCIGGIVFAGYCKWDYDFIYEMNESCKLCQHCLVIIITVTCTTIVIIIIIIFVVYGRRSVSSVISLRLFMELLEGRGCVV